MPVTISDEVLKRAGLNEREARIEIASRLFEAGRLALWDAAQFAELSRDEFWSELQRRQIAAFTIDHSDIEHDLKTLERLCGPEDKR